MRSFRLSPSLVISLVALFVALGGTSYAVATNSIGSKQIKNNSIQSKDIKNNQVSTKDVKNRSLLSKDFKAGQVPAGPRGPGGAIGPVGPRGFQGQHGQQGIQGIQGSASASAVFGGVQNLGTLAGGASVFTNPADTVSAPDSQNVLTPNAVVTLRDLAVQSNGTNLPANVSLKVTLDGPSSSITCTIPTGSRSCNSGAQTATVPPASEISITIQNTGTASYPDSPAIEFGWRATG